MENIKKAFYSRGDCMIRLHKLMHSGKLRESVTLFRRARLVIKEMK